MIFSKDLLSDLQSGVSGCCRSHLVRTGGKLQFPRVFVISQPTPARALDSHSGGAQFGLHGLEATKVSGDKFGQGSSGLSGASRAQVLHNNN